MRFRERIHGEPPPIPGNLRTVRDKDGTWRVVERLNTVFGSCLITHIRGICCPRHAQVLQGSLYTNEHLLGWREETQRVLNQPCSCEERGKP